MRYKSTRSGLILWLTISLFMAGTCPGFGQESETDSVMTAFRKGRWLTGLEGSISSGSAKFDTVSNRSFSNQYSFNFTTGKFFKDRWLLGGVFELQRDNSRQFVEIESETLLVAPLLSYYLSDNKLGSLFFSVAPGYARFREKTVQVVLSNPSQEELKGGGFGVLVQLGYSYVLHDRIVFDLGLGLNGIWANARRKLDDGQTGEKIKISNGNILFSFGFNVLLDEFFF